MRWTPQSWVAVILASCVMAFFLIAGLVRILVPEYEPNADMLDLFSRVVDTLVGGLIGWISAGVGLPARRDDDR